MPFCASCGHEVATGVPFCPQCGASMNGTPRAAAGTVCPSCGREAAGSGRFCRFCATSLLDRDTRLATVMQRLLAAIVDGFVFVGWWVAITVVFGIGAAIPRIGILIGPLLGLAVLIAGAVWWFKLLSRGVTPGKSVLGIRVTRTDGGAPGLGVMLVREWIGKYISGFVGGLGWIWAIFDPDRQTWHDKIVGTVVVVA